MKTQPQSYTARPPLRELQPSLQVVCGKSEEAIEPSSGHTLPFVFGGRAHAANNPTSLWSLSSPNLASTDQLVTLEQIDDSEEEVADRAAPDTLAQSSLIAQLREQTATATQTLKMKAFQLEEYERELELAHAKIEVLERKNEQLRAGFEQRLAKFEETLQVRRQQSRAETDLVRLRLITGQLPALKVGVEAMGEGVLQLKQLCARQFEALRAAENSRGVDRATIATARKKLIACAEVEAELTLRLSEMNRRADELMLIRDKLQKRAQRAAKGQQLAEEALSNATQQLVTLTADLAASLEAAKEGEAHLQAVKDRLDRAETAVRISKLCKQRLKRKLRRGSARSRSLHSLLTLRKSAPRPRLCRQHAMNATHSCLSGRGLCPRRQRLEALKRAWGL